MKVISALKLRQTRPECFAVALQWETTDPGADLLGCVLSDLMRDIRHARVVDRVYTHSARKTKPLPPVELEKSQHNGVLRWEPDQQSQTTVLLTDLVPCHQTWLGLLREDFPSRKPEENAAQMSDWCLLDSRILPRAENDCGPPSCKEVVFLKSTEESWR